MERPACIRCQRKTRSEQCVYEDQATSANLYRPSTTCDVKRTPSDDIVEECSQGDSCSNDEDPLLIIANEVSVTEPGLFGREIVLADEKKDMLQLKPLRRDEYERFFGIEDVFRSQMSRSFRCRLQEDPEEVYASVFYQRWMPRSALLARPRNWNENFRGVVTGMPALDSAIKAIGALQIERKIEAASRYSECLQQLIPRLKSEESSIASLETCTTILLLLCYELMNEARIDNFESHLCGVSYILRQQVQYLRKGGDPSPLRSPLAILMYRSYRNIETVEACLMQKQPRLALDEWNTLLPIETCWDTEDFERHLTFEYMNISTALTATDVTTDLGAIETLHTALLSTCKRLSYTAQLFERVPEVDALDYFDLDGVKSPYSTNLYVPGCNNLESIHRSTITALLLTTQLHLELFMPDITAARLFQSAKTLIRLTQHTLSSPEENSSRGRHLPSAVYTLATCGRALHKAGVSGRVADWVIALLHAAYRAMIS